MATQKERSRRWYLKNKKLIKQRQKERYQKNRPEKLLYAKNYAKEHPEVVGKARDKFKHSEKGRLSIKKDNESEAGKKRQERYRHSEKGRKTKREYTKKWRQTKKGKLVHIIQTNKRRRNLSHVELFPNTFPDEVVVQYHHINSILVAPLPAEIHDSLPSFPVENHRLMANKKVEQIYGIDLNKILNDRMG
jgi:hypothetical protein